MPVAQIIIAVYLAVFVSMAVVIGANSLIKKGKSFIMSALSDLTAVVKTAADAITAFKASDAALTATVTDLTAQVAKLKAEAGTPDASLEPLTKELADALNPPSPPPAPEPTPADPVVTVA